MKVAIYSRFSSDAQDQTSIDGQFTNCKDLAARNGWAVTRHISDEAISGTDQARPGYLALLACSEAGEIDGIVVDETSRLTRSPGELPRLLELLSFRNQFLIDCKGFDSRQETASLLAAVYGGIDSLELRKIKDRTHRGLRERHKAGFSAGGKTYGYTTKPIDVDDPQSKKKTEIVPDQAEIVIEIFTRYADGESPRSIVDDFNRRGVPSPGSTWKRSKRRAKGWTMTALVGTAKMFTGILRREQYIGEIVWNRRKSKKIPGTSKRVYELRPESEWIRVKKPELRIVDDLLWRKVQARLKAARDRSHPNTLAKRGRQPRYLLSGLMRCGDCGSNYIMHDGRAYVCSSHTNGGQHLCKNKIRVRRDVAESVLLANIKKRLLSDDMTDYVEKQFHAALREMEAEHGGPAIESEIDGLDRKIAKVLDAIENVGISDSLAHRLRSLEAEKRDAKESLEAAEADKEPLGDLPDLVPALIDRWRALVADFEGLPSNPNAEPGDLNTARRHLHALLGQVTLKPKDGVLWAHPTLNAKGLTKVSPLHMCFLTDSLQIIPDT